MTSIHTLESISPKGRLARLLENTLIERRRIHPPRSMQDEGQESSESPEDSETAPTHSRRSSLTELLRAGLVALKRRDFSSSPSKQDDLQYGRSGDVLYKDNKIAAYRLRWFFKHIVEENPNVPLVLAFFRTYKAHMTSTAVLSHLSDRWDFARAQDHEFRESARKRLVYLIELWLKELHVERHDLEFLSTLSQFVLQLATVSNQHVMREIILEIRGRFLAERENVDRKSHVNWTRSRTTLTLSTVALEVVAQQLTLMASANFARITCGDLLSCITHNKADEWSPRMIKLTELSNNITNWVLDEVERQPSYQYWTIQRFAGIAEYCFFARDYFTATAILHALLGHCYLIPIPWSSPEIEAEITDLVKLGINSEEYKQTFEGSPLERCVPNVALRRQDLRVILENAKKEVIPGDPTMLNSGWYLTLAAKLARLVSNASSYTFARQPLIWAYVEDQLQQAAMRHSADRNHFAGECVYPYCPRCSRPCNCPERALADLRN